MSLHEELLQFIMKEWAQLPGEVRCEGVRCDCVSVVGGVRCECMRCKCVCEG